MWFRFVFILVFNMSYAHKPMDFLADVGEGPMSGAKIYMHYCALCHSEEPTISLGAPRINHPKEWQGRLDKGIDGLLKAMDEGLGAMPARGGCFECTDNQLKAAIRYLLK